MGGKTGQILRLLDSNTRKLTSICLRQTLTHIWLCSSNVNSRMVFHQT